MNSTRSAATLRLMLALLVGTLLLVPSLAAAKGKQGARPHAPLLHSGRRGGVGLCALVPRPESHLRNSTRHYLGENGLPLRWRRESATPTGRPSIGSTPTETSTQKPRPAYLGTLGPIIRAAGRGYDQGLPEEQSHDSSACGMPRTIKARQHPPARRAVRRRARRAPSTPMEPRAPTRPTTSGTGAASNGHLHLARCRGAPVPVLRTRAPSSGSITPTHQIVVAEIQAGLSGVIVITAQGTWPDTITPTDDLAPGASTASSSICGRSLMRTGACTPTSTSPSADCGRAAFPKSISRRAT